MPVFEYKNHADPRDSAYFNHPHNLECIYCRSKLRHIDIDDYWPISDQEILSIHEETKASYKEVHGLEDCYLNLQMNSADVEISGQYCTTCGWWRLVKDICICAEARQIWDIFFGCVGTLKNLSLEDIDTPIEEIHNYLIARYSDRFIVNPRIFEQVIASVFKNLGHYVHVTGYSNDGGVDVILGNSKENMVGVQVKRYKNRIKVEQIRAFAGALMLGNFTKGIFVTTSQYQPGAIKAAEAFSKTFPIELIDSEKFYDALKISQKQNFDISNLSNSINKIVIPNIFPYGWDTPRNSL